MIVKKITRKSQGQFKLLAQYILRADRESPEIGRVRVSNCAMEDPALAVKEIAATQARNTRSQADKTCHLMVSFPTGENPTPAQLEDIEDELCHAMGLGDHQRLSVVHLDTGHVHVHLAINKVHPLSHNNVERLRDHFQLAAACERLEERHRLARDNHPQRFAEHQRAPGVGVMAAHGTHTPFHDWALTHKAALSEALHTASGWSDLHRALARQGMEIKPRGAGLVLAAKGTSTHIKASAFGRDFSLAKLTERFGPYQAPTAEIQSLAAETHYTPARKHNLWADYQRERQRILSERQQALDAIKRQRGKEAEAIKTDLAGKRSEVRKSRLLTRQQKRELYSSLSARRKERYAALSEQTAQARQAVRDEHAAPDWRGWLQARTEQGDRAAERTLARAVRRDEERTGAVKRDRQQRKQRKQQTRQQRTGAQHGISR